MAEWAEVIAAEPRSATPYMLRARWVGQTDVRGALADLDLAVAAEPRNPATYARRGDCLRALGDEERALANYRRAVGLDPKLFDVHHVMAMTLTALGQHQEALAAHDAAIRLAPRYLDFYLARAATHEQLDDLEAAIRDYDRVLELDPERVEVRSHRAICRAKRGDLDRAMEEMTALVDPDEPDAGEALAVLGGLHVTLRQWDKAIELLDRAVALAPDSVAARGQRARALVETGRHEEALADYDRAIALGPDDADHHAGRAKALALLTRLPEAVEAASRAIAIKPDHILAHRLRAVYRSHAEGDAGIPAVKADLRRVAELAPDSVIYRREYTEYLLEMGDVDEAIAFIDEALARTPDDAGLHYDRGYCYSRRDEILYSVTDDHVEEEDEERVARCTTALEELEKAVSLGLHDEDLYFELVRVREELGDPEAFMRELDRGLSHFPDALPFLVLRHDRRRLGGDAEGAAADRARLAALGHNVDA
jgi:tetratricopeptide (TPR) repeat protein